MELFCSPNGSHSVLLFKFSLRNHCHLISSASSVFCSLKYPQRLFFSEFLFSIYFYFVVLELLLSEFLRWSLMIFIIKGFQTVVFIFMVISTTFRPICLPTFFRCLSNSGATYTELRTTSFIGSTGVTCSDSVNHNRVQALSIPVLLLACSQDWTCHHRMIVSIEA